MPELPPSGVSVAAPLPAHAPERGLAHRLLGPLHVTGVFWYRLHYFGASRLPAWLVRAGILAFTSFFFVVLTRIRRALAENLVPVLGPASLVTRWGWSYRTMNAFADCMTERYRRAARPQLMQFVLDGESNWREATRDGRGAVVVTAHIGPWEVGAQLGAAEGQRRIHVVREEELDPRAQAFISELQAKAAGEYVTHFASGDPNLALELRDALGRGEIVALQGDRPRAGGRTVPATLFGRPFPLPIGPLILARISGVSILPVFNFREGPFRIRTVVRPPITLSAAHDRQADLAAAAQQLARDIEWAIRDRPHQWFCFRWIWP